MSTQSAIGPSFRAIPMERTPSSPVGTVMRRLRKTASTMGLNVGGPGEYDANTVKDDDMDSEEEDKRNNGTRVWYG